MEINRVDSQPSAKDVPSGSLGTYASVRSFRHLIPRLFRALE
jgi:hypothetical protein